MVVIVDVFFHCRFKSLKLSKNLNKNIWFKRKKDKQQFAYPLVILFHCTNHFIYIARRICYYGFCLAGSYITESVYVGFILFFYNFSSYCSSLIGEAASVFSHNFIIRIYRFLWVRLPFRIENIGLSEKEGKSTKK